MKHEGGIAPISHTKTLPAPRQPLLQEKSSALQGQQGKQSTTTMKNNLVTQRSLMKCGEMAGVTAEGELQGKVEVSLTGPLQLWVSITPRRLHRCAKRLFSRQRHPGLGGRLQAGAERPI